MSAYDDLMYTNCTRFNAWDIISNYDPAVKGSFKDNYPAWSDELARSPVRSGDALSLCWELAVKYGGGGSPRQVFGWLAAGLFQEFLPMLAGAPSEEQMRQRAKLLLDAAEMQLDEKFMHDERYPKEKSIILGMIEKKVEQYFKAPGPIGETISPQKYEFLRKSIIGSSHQPGGGARQGGKGRAIQCVRTDNG